MPSPRLVVLAMPVTGENPELTESTLPSTLAVHTNCPVKAIAKR